MITDHTGYLIDPTDLEENLIQTIGNISPEILKNMEQSCRDRALDFSLAVMHTKISQYIQ